jgi:phosphate transport system substrate-binding protein
MQRLWRNFILVLTAASVVASCGEERQRGRGEGDGDGADAKKQVITQKGSDTMILLAQRWAEAYAKKNPNVQVQVTGGGSGTGISALINGTTDIANASRPMKDEERQQVKAKYGSDVVEIPVAKDGITIYTHSSNTVDQLTVAQLRDIYSGRITNWKDVGGPDRKIVLYGRENSSGTYEYFKEHVLNKGDFTASTQTLSGTAAVVSAVSKDEGGLGYGGEAFGTEGIKRVKLAGDDGTAVEATEANVLAGTYPLSRSLYFYLRVQPTGATKEYIDWVLSPEGQQEVKEAGYFPLK